VILFLDFLALYAMIRGYVDSRRGFELVNSERVVKLLKNHHRQISRAIYFRAAFLVADILESSESNS